MNATTAQTANTGATATRWFFAHALLSVLALSMSVAVVQGELLYVAVVAGVAAAVVVFLCPDFATLLFVFLLYSNAAVVAVRSHGVPLVVGAASGLLLLWPAGCYVAVRRQPLIVPRVFWLVFLFVIIQFISAMLCSQPQVALKTVIISLGEGLLLFILIVNVVRTPRMLQATIWAALVAGAMLSALGLFQQIAGTHDNDYGGFAQVDIDLTVAGPGGLQEHPRLAGPLGLANRHGHLMVLLVPLGLYQFFGERDGRLRLAAMAVTLLITAEVMLTYSRGAAIGLGVIALAVVCLKTVRLRYVAGLVLVLPLVFAVVPLYTARLSSLIGLWGLISDSQSRSLRADSALQGRANEAKSAVLIFARRPLLGVGPGMYPHYYDEVKHWAGPGQHHGKRLPHNLYLGLAAEQGLIGVGCFLLILIVLLRDLAIARRRCRTTNPRIANTATAFLVLLVAYMTLGFFSDFSYVRYYWLMLALAGVTVQLANWPCSAGSYRGEFVP